MSDEHHLPRDWNDEPIEISIIDDLATVLSRIVVGWQSVIGIDLAKQPEVVRVLARYRAYKEGQVDAWIQVQQRGGNRDD